MSALERVGINYTAMNICYLCRQKFKRDEPLVMLFCDHVLNENCYNPWAKGRPFKACPECNPLPPKVTQVLNSMPETVEEANSKCCTRIFQGAMLALAFFLGLSWRK